MSVAAKDNNEFKTAAELTDVKHTQTVTVKDKPVTLTYFAGDQQHSPDGSYAMQLTPEAMRIQAAANSPFFNKGEAEKIASLAFAKAATAIVKGKMGNPVLQARAQQYATLQRVTRGRAKGIQARMQMEAGRKMFDMMPTPVMNRVMTERQVEAVHALKPTTKQQRVASQAFTKKASMKAQMTPQAPRLTRVAAHKVRDPYADLRAAEKQAIPFEMKAVASASKMVGNFAEAALGMFGLSSAPKPTARKPMENAANEPTFAKRPGNRPQLAKGMQLAA